MTLLDRLQSQPTLGVALPFRGFIRYRESRPQGQADQAPLILLHGIGSGSGSWLHQLTDPRLGRMLAWDAPGYADSSPLKMQEPAAADYAQVLWAWLDALNIQQAHLVGHSLGCIMAAAAARLQPQRVKKLTLLAPAQGYGTAPEAVRIKKRDERLQAMGQLGLQKMAEQRAPRLLSPAASAEQIELATHMMSRLNESGYTQATFMLSTADIRADLQAFKQQSAVPIRVACGDQDVITPPNACEALARFIQALYTPLPGAGHLCALQVPQAIAPLLLS
jgi:pimeloyl-ACP methyl ester carboxylesterase